MPWVSSAERLCRLWPGSGLACCPPQFGSGSKRGQPIDDREKYASPRRPAPHSVIGGISCQHETLTLLIDSHSRAPREPDRPMPRQPPGFERLETLPPVGWSGVCPLPAPVRFRFEARPADRRYDEVCVPALAARPAHLWAEFPVNLKLSPCRSTPTAAPYVSPTAGGADPFRFSAELTVNMRHSRSGQHLGPTTLRSHLPGALPSASTFCGGRAAGG
jgi:hypothetical protein